jgi:3-hydroxybutyryl-CoA dehydratase
MITEITTAPSASGSGDSTAHALREGVRIEVPFRITRPDMEMFATLSGDRNPIHFDDEYALSRGLLGAVVYGGLLVARVSELIGMKLPTKLCLWTGLKLTFHRPLYVGEAAVLAAEITHVSDAVRSLMIKLKIIAGERLIASGSADVTYWDD